MSPRALASTLPKITKAIIERGGRDYAALVTEWALVVGPALAESSVPEKLQKRRSDHERSQLGGTLTLRVTSGAAMEFQHREPQIIERINAYLGHRAVDRLKLVQGPVHGRRRGGIVPRQLTPTESQAVDSSVEKVGDTELRSRLARFGRALAGRRARSVVREN